MTLKLVNHFILPQNKVVWHLICLNLVSKTPFLVKCGLETSKCFVLYETQYVELLKCTDSEFDNCFLKFSYQNTFCGQDWSQNLDVLLKPCFILVFKDTDSELENYFLKFCPQSSVFGQIWSRNFEVLSFRWYSIHNGSQGWWFLIWQLFS